MRRFSTVPESLPESLAKQNSLIARYSNFLAHIVVPFSTGSLFAVGLGVSGMTNPEKVQSFLDPLFTTWDPSLAFVMGGAVILNLYLFNSILKRKHPVLLANYCLPNQTQITRQLMLGSATFGVGWGLAGICPGPGILSFTTGLTPFWVWNAGMFAGFLLYRLAARRNLLS